MSRPFVPHSKWRTDYDHFHDARVGQRGRPGGPAAHRPRRSGRSNGDNHVPGQKNISGNWTDIFGETNQTYTVTEADEGNALRVVETATDGGTSATSTSDPTAAVTDITLGFTSGASIDNIAPREGDTLFAVNGSLNDADAFVTSYQWQQNLDRPPRGDELDLHRRAGK